MRALRVVGLGEDGAVICECPELAGEQFSLPADETLRAAARGDLARLGQIEIELESQMRPREIQARIRAGASVEQVAAAAGVSIERIDRFAYPVLLERSRMAELAQLAHPVRPDGPDVRILGEVVANTFIQRGHDYSSATWDSWRGEDGKWVVQLQWQAGRSDNRAHWTYHPGAHGGTVTTLDDLAIDLIDPDAGVSLRTVRPVTPLGEQDRRADEPSRRVDRAAERAADRSERVERPAPEPALDEPAAGGGSGGTPAAGKAASNAGKATTGGKAGDPAGSNEPAGPVEAADAEEATGTTEPAPPRRGRRNHPIVPSWEDVLLGVRSNR